MSDIRVIDVARSADVLVRKCLAVKEGEQVLIITDTEYEFIIANALAAASNSVGAETTIAIMPKREISGATLAIERAIEAADVVITATTRSVVHSPAIRKALHEEKSIRIGTTLATYLPGFIGDGANCDPDELWRLTERVREAIMKGKELRFASDLGTDLTGSLEGMPIRNAGGLARNAGELTCFPDGEVWLAPKEGTAEGTVVIDKMMTYLGPLSEPIKYEVKKGRVVSTEGGTDANRLKELTEGVKNIDNIAEMAVGTNPKAKYIGEIMNDKHVLGSVHVAIGDNRIYGGTTDCKLHIDGVISKATVEVDGKVIVKNGQLVI